MVRKYFNSKGFMSIYLILFLAVFIPIMFFLVIDLPQFMAMNRKAKGALDNASSTAITRINEDKTTEGILEINETEARNIAKKVIVETFNLNDDLTVNENSSIPDTPKIEILIVNNPNERPYHETPNGKFYFKNPSVLIYAEIPVEASFFKFAKKTIKYTSVSQVQFKK